MTMNLNVLGLLVSFCLFVCFWFFSGEGGCLHIEKIERVMKRECRQDMKQRLFYFSFLHNFSSVARH